MKMYLPIILLTASVSLSIVAVDEAQATTTTHTNSSGMMEHQGMMNNQNMKNMHPRMQEMSSLMQQIVNEDNLQKREVLMAEHMKKMQENMRMMDESGTMHSSTTELDDKPLVPVDERINILEERIYTMQALMEQMMEHNAQREMSPKKMHKEN